MVDTQKKYKVCVHCITYNHKNYLEDALKGFIMQKTTFPFIVIVVDDCSTDGNTELLKEYEALYPHIISAIYLKENYHSKHISKAPFFQPFDEQSEFIALCEGDDYWTDPYKLQKQVEYMDVNAKCSMCIHRALWEVAGEVTPGGCQYSLPCDMSMDTLIRNGGLYFATASFLFRTELAYDFPYWRKVSMVGDYPLQILCGLKGSVHYLPEAMCVYRYLRDGSWTQKQLDANTNISFHKNKIEWMTLLNIDTKRKYQKAIYSQLFMSFHVLFTKREVSVLSYASAIIKSKEFHHGRFIKDIIRVYLTPFYRFIYSLKNV